MIKTTVYKGKGGLVKYGSSLIPEYNIIVVISFLGIKIHAYSCRMTIDDAERIYGKLLDTKRGVPEMPKHPSMPALT